MAVSRKLTDGPDGQLYIVAGNPEIGYDLLKVTTEPVNHPHRSWQALAAAHGEPVLDEGA
jgi:hypothetical protein